MEKFTLHMLEYEGIKQDLAGYAVSYEGRARAAGLAPREDLRMIQREMEETGEALELLRKGSSIPLPSLDGIEVVISLMGTGYLFTPQDLTAVQTFLQSCGQLKRYMVSKGEAAWRIGVYSSSLQELPVVQQEILRCIRHGAVTNEASKELDKIRKKIAVLKEKIGQKVQAVMSRHAAILQENIVSLRGGRYVIPVKREWHKQVKGKILDQSTSGQTVFIEPQEISSLHAEMEMLQGEEAREETKILGILSELLERDSPTLRQNIDITGKYDFIFAKAKYAASMDAIAVELNDRGETVIRGGKHPQLMATMVPLDVEIGSSYKGLIITGPNTGGKTVVLKTVGILTLMVQSGLLVPVQPGSRFAIYRSIMAVIGDGQNLEQSLSTFSAQIHNLVQMLKAADTSTLLLIDELAAGTDPSEGIALSIALLEAFGRKGATVMVTTHFNELKTFASQAKGFENARMEFDAATLLPLYRLTIGHAGQSYAIEIATKLGIASDVIARSQEIIQGQRRDSREVAFAIDPFLDKSERVREVEQIGKQPHQPHQPHQQHQRHQRHQQHQSHQVHQTDHTDQVEMKAPIFEIGDAVWVTSLKKMGIISELEDSRGMFEVQIQKQRIKVNRKRLKPYIKKTELYPDDYDMDIVFDSKENRKKRKLMSKRHIEGLSIELQKD